MIVLLACAPPPDCMEGYAANADGICLAETTGPFSGGSSVDELLDALPPCEAMEAGDRIDPDAACVDGACANNTFTEIDAALGGDASCIRRFDDQHLDVHADCSWPRGITTSFSDYDDDGVPDADSLASPLYLVPPYDGASQDGLGLEAGLGCFVDAYGPPEWMYLVHDGEHWWPGTLVWNSDTLDVGWTPESGPWDGTPSWIRMPE
ncbi:MAG: hypothetical protein Q8P18_08565 [Pseudomonadota bacterium]|nr:hypothetical protein [Pseudomonadota bacterium]